MVCPITQGDHNYHYYWIPPSTYKFAAAKKGGRHHIRKM